MSKTKTSRRTVPVSTPLPLPKDEDAFKWFDSGEELYESLQERGSTLMELQYLLENNKAGNIMANMAKCLDIDKLTKEVQGEVNDLILSMNQNTTSITDKLLLTLPKQNVYNTQVLKEDYEKFEGLKWSYSNKNIVKEADNVFEESKWVSDDQPDEELLNPHMYHVLKDSVCNMKTKLLEKKQKIEMACRLKNFHNKSICVYNNGYLPADNSELMKILEESFEHVDALLKLTKNINSLSELEGHMFMVDLTAQTVHIWEKNLRILIKRELENLKANLEEVAADSSEELKEKLAVIYFIALLNKFDVEAKVLARAQGSKHFDDIFKILKTYDKKNMRYDDIFKNVLEAIYNGNAKKSKYYGKKLEEIQKLEATKDNKAYEAIMHSFMQLNQLIISRKKVVDFLKFIDNMKAHEVIAVLKGTDEAMKRKFKIKQLTATAFKSKLSILRDMLEQCINRSAAQAAFRHIMVVHKSMEATIRKLNYFWGTALMEAKRVMTDKKYKSDEKKRALGLNNIAKALHFSVIAVDDMLKF